ncbi:MAG: M28 family peptidase, partial [Calditrichaeota bacterium]
LRPARTLRFIWPPEIEGTLALLSVRPELATKIKAVIHMDMVGGGPNTKAIFHITRGPTSLPSIIHDVAASFGRLVNRESDAFASGQTATFPLISPEGGKEALQAEFADFEMGSDHQVYNEGSFRIPAIYMNDWPDRYIHTNFDTPANIDPTKLKRAAFIGAASGYVLANLASRDAPALWRIFRSQCLRRTATMLRRRADLPAAEAQNLTRFHLWYERQTFRSMTRFFKIPQGLESQAEAFFSKLENLVGPVTPAAAATGNGALVYHRNPNIKGPLQVFGYDYLVDHYGPQARAIGLLKYQGDRGAGSEYAYEVLNFVDGQRTVQEIRDAVSAEYGPIPLNLVLEYLGALERIGVIKK